MAEVTVSRKLVAEFVGTAALVVCGPGTAAATGVIAKSSGVAFSMAQLGIISFAFMLVIVGGLFVVEALSVIVQVASFKSRGKRVFRMSPLHHHFELVGWSEMKVVIRFWIIAIIFALLGLATLKLR